MDCVSLESLLNVDNYENERNILQAIHSCIQMILDYKETHLFCKPNFLYNVYRFFYTFIYDSTQECHKIVSETILFNCYDCIIQYHKYRSIFLTTLSQIYDVNTINSLYIEYMNWDAARLIHKFNTFFLDFSCQTNQTNLVVISSAILEYLRIEELLHQYLDKNHQFFSLIQSFIQALEKSKVASDLCRAFLSNGKYQALRYLVQASTSSNPTVRSIITSLWSSKPSIQWLQLQHVSSIDYLPPEITEPMKTWKTQILNLLDQHFIMNPDSRNIGMSFSRLSILFKGYQHIFEFLRSISRSVYSNIALDLSWICLSQFLRMSLSQSQFLESQIVYSCNFYTIILDQLLYISQNCLSFPELFSLFNSGDLLTFVKNLACLYMSSHRYATFHQNLALFLKEILLYMILNEYVITDTNSIIDQYIDILTLLWKTCQFNTMEVLLCSDSSSPTSLKYYSTCIIWSILGLNSYLFLKKQQHTVNKLDYFFLFLNHQTIDTPHQNTQSLDPLNKYQPLIYQNYQLLRLLKQFLNNFNSNNLSPELSHLTLISFKNIFMLCFIDVYYDFMHYQLCSVFISFYSTEETNFTELQESNKKKFPEFYCYLEMIDLFVIKYHQISAYSSTIITSLILNALGYLLIVPDILDFLLLAPHQESKPSDKTINTKYDSSSQQRLSSNTNINPNNRLMILWVHIPRIRQIIFRTICCSIFCLQNIIDRLSFMSKHFESTMDSQRNLNLSDMNPFFKNYNKLCNLSILPLIDTCEVYGFHVNNLLSIKSWQLNTLDEFPSLVNNLELQNQLLEDPIINIFFRNIGTIINRKIPPLLINQIYTLLDVLLALKDKRNDCTELERTICKETPKQIVITNKSRYIAYHIPSCQIYGIMSLISTCLQEKSYDMKQYKLIESFQIGCEIMVNFWNEFMQKIKAVSQKLQSKYKLVLKKEVFFWNHFFFYASDLFWELHCIEPILNDFFQCYEKFVAFNLDAIPLLTQFVSATWKMFKLLLESEPGHFKEMKSLGVTESNMIYTVHDITFSGKVILKESFKFFESWISLCHKTLHQFISTNSVQIQSIFLNNKTLDQSIKNEKRFSNDSSTNNPCHIRHYITAKTPSILDKNEHNYSNFVSCIIDHFRKNLIWIERIIYWSLVYEGQDIIHWLRTNEIDHQSINMKDLQSNLFHLHSFKSVTNIFTRISESNQIIMNSFKSPVIKTSNFISMLSKGGLYDPFYEYIKNHNRKTSSQSNHTFGHCPLDSSLLLKLHDVSSLKKNDTQIYETGAGKKNMYQTEYNMIVSANQGTSKSNDGNNNLSSKQIKSSLDQHVIYNGGRRNNNDPLSNHRNSDTSRKRFFNSTENKYIVNDSHPIEHLNNKDDSKENAKLKKSVSSNLKNKIGYNFQINSSKFKTNATVLVTGLSPMNTHNYRSKDVTLESWNESDLHISDAALRHKLYEKANEALYVEFNTIMEWDYFNLNNVKITLPNCIKDGLLCSFENIEEFRKYYKPLLLEECRCSMIQNMSEKALQGIPLCIIGTTRLGSAVVLTSKSVKGDANSNEGLSNMNYPYNSLNTSNMLSSTLKKSDSVEPIRFQLWDLILLTPNEKGMQNELEGKYLSEIQQPPFSGYLIAVVDEDTDKEHNEWDITKKNNNSIKLRCPYVLSTSASKQLRRISTSRISINSTWIAYSISSLLTTVREFQSLWVSELSKIFPFILNPKIIKQSNCSESNNFKFNNHNHNGKTLYNAYGKHSSKNEIKTENMNFSEWLKMCIPLLKQKLYLNDSQISAISHALSINPAIALIQGPPGTGKTKTLISLLTILYNYSMYGYSKLSKCGNESKLRIIVCAPSNAAVDEITVRILKGIVNLNDSHNEELLHPCCVRVGNPKRITRDEVMTISFTLNLRKEEDQSDEKKLNEYRLRKLQLNEKLNEIKTNIDELDSISNKQSQLNTSKKKSDLERIYELKRQKRNIEINMGLLKEQFHNDFKAGRSSCQEELLGKSDIVFTTLSGSASKCLINMKFDFLIIDEAAQSVELSTLIPLRLNPSRIVLIGDPQQLPATVISRVAKKFEYERSLFQRLSDCGVEIKMLSIQYRMHQLICSFPSMHFYQNQLKNAHAIIKKTPSIFHHWSFLFRPILFFNLDHDSTHGNNAKRLSNMTEVYFIFHLLQLFAKYFINNSHFKCIEWNDISIITPYREQLVELRRYFHSKLANSPESIPEMCTVDAFQGREKRIIILSCVRSKSLPKKQSYDQENEPGEISGFNNDFTFRNARQLENKSNSTQHNLLDQKQVQNEMSELGFLADIRRLNVAITRAKDCLWIVGNSLTLQNNTSWKALIDHYKNTTYSNTRLLNNPCNHLVETGFVDIQSTIQYLNNVFKQYRNIHYQNGSSEHLISIFFSLTECHQLHIQNQEKEEHQCTQISKKDTIKNKKYLSLSPSLEKEFSSSPSVQKTLSSNMYNSILTVEENNFSDCSSLITISDE